MASFFALYIVVTVYSHLAALFIFRFRSHPPKDAPQRTTTLGK